MKRLAILFFVLSGIAAAQTTTPLQSGQRITLHGTLDLVAQGRLQFVTVKTAESYSTAEQTLHEVALSGYHRYDLLAAHRGEAVMVNGAIMIDSASPYYYKSTSLMATSIRLQDGTELIGESRVQDVAGDLGMMSVNITLPAELTTPWTYKGIGFDAEHRPAVCSSNGGGDVVNCYCPLGFQAAGATMNADGKQDLAKRMGQMAQFPVGDAARLVTLSLLCRR